jgi:hypothetical protein
MKKNGFYQKIIIVASLSLGAIFLSSCVFAPHLNDANALQKLRQIRQAEKTYYESHGKNNYGALDILAENNLIDDDLADGKDQGHTFDLRVTGSSYTVNASPIGENAGGCFFMDESGVIRASYRDDVPANRSSEAIKNQ